MKPDEYQQVADFAIEGMRCDLYPGLRLQRAKVDHVVQHFGASQSDFHQIAVDGGRVVAALAAAVSDMLFFERSEAHVVMCRSVMPGVGRKLIAALRAWADADMRIRRVQFPQEFHADPRARRMLARYGFTQQVTTCVYNKGGLPA
jgi:hypothetical protein